VHTTLKAFQCRVATCGVASPVCSIGCRSPVLPAHLCCCLQRPQHAFSLPVALRCRISFALYFLASYLLNNYCAERMRKGPRAHSIYSASSPELPLARPCFKHGYCTRKFAACKDSISWKTMVTRPRLLAGGGGAKAVSLHPLLICTASAALLSMPVIDGGFRISPHVSASLISLTSDLSNHPMSKCSSACSFCTCACGEPPRAAELSCSRLAQENMFSSPRTPLGPRHGPLWARKIKLTH